MAVLANGVREGRVWANSAFPSPGYRVLLGAALMAEPRGEEMLCLSELCHMV